jgi:glycosyltransferase involved in cell wall biosynthesis
MSQPEITVEVSVVIPCLNEHETIGVCVDKSLESFRDHDITGEVIVADNGSQDGSVEIAMRRGARVVHVREKGYGSALMGGIAEARGRFVIMGDADDSYDFREIPRFLEKLREGYDIVQGCRFPSGGGRIMKGAMPLLHRWFGNPLLSYLVRIMFGAGINDVYCGMRGFSKEFYRGLAQQCTGMEFATEMIIKATLYKAKMTEVPITLHKDGRVKHKPHLRTFHDGWRTLRFYLLYSPNWLFVLPGSVLTLVGLAGFLLGFFGVKIGAAGLGGHTVAVSGLLIILGSQSVIVGIYVNVFSVVEQLRPAARFTNFFLDDFRLEYGILAGLFMMLVGFTTIGALFTHWAGKGFGPLDYTFSIRWIILGATLSALGFQNIVGSFLLSTISLHRRWPDFRL